MHAILRQLRRAALLSEGNSLSDAQLLESFLSDRDEAAFEALVRRHGPMVLAVCRRVTGNAHDAEDAFQATFLVLVRKAASLRSGQLLPGWLYRVAYRTALNARAMKKKRRAKEQHAAQEPRAHPDSDGVSEELLARLDEALNRLPDRYRLPVVLCELQGHSRKEAAQLLGVPTGTVSWRLAQARKLLAQRLARYGTMLSAGAVAAALSQNPASGVPLPLVRAVTLQALASGAVQAPIQALTEGVLKAMLLSKLKVVWGVALAAIVGAGAVGLMYRPAVAADPKQPGSSGATARVNADELDELRLEIAALRKGLQATRERVKMLEDRVAMLSAPGSGAGSAGAPAALMQQRMQDMMQNFQRMQGPILKPGAALRPPSGGPGSKGRPIIPGEYPKPHGTPGPKDGDFQNQVYPLRELTVPADQKPTSPAEQKKPQAGTQRPAPAYTVPETQKRMLDAFNATLAPAARDQERIYKLTISPAAQGKAEIQGPKESQLSPLAAAQAALKQLRKNPNDTKAADRLERALKRLELEQVKHESGAKP